MDELNHGRFLFEGISFLGMHSSMTCKKSATASSSHQHYNYTVEWTSQKHLSTLQHDQSLSGYITRLFLEPSNDKEKWIPLWLDKASGGTTEQLWRLRGANKKKTRSIGVGLLAGVVCVGRGTTWESKKELITRAGRAVPQSYINYSMTRWIVWLDGDNKRLQTTRCSEYKIKTISRYDKQLIGDLIIMKFSYGP